MHAYWTSMLWSIDSCQNIVSAALYHLTVLRARVSTHRGQVFRPSYPLTSYYFSNDRRLKFNFFIIHLTYAVFMCRTIKSLILNWPRTRKFSQLFKAGKTIAFDVAHHSHVLVTLNVQFLCSDWSKLDRWVHAENLCSISNLVYFDSWSVQSFVSTCDVFNRSFHWMYKVKFSCYSWLVCLLGFWLRNTSLVKAGNPISDGMVFVLRLAWCVHIRRGLKVWSDTAGLTWYLSGAASRMVSLSNYCIDVCFFNSNLMKPSVVFYVAI